MKYLLIFFITIVLFNPYFEILAQKKSKKKKIETWQVNASVDCWYFCCDEAGNYDDTCVDKVKIRFENESSYSISRITFLLIIECDNVVIYRKKHSLNVDIGPNEVVSYELKLSSKVTAFRGLNYECFVDYFVIISVE